MCIPFNLQSNLTGTSPQRLLFWRTVHSMTVLLTSEPVPGVRIVECGAKKESEKKIPRSHPYPTPSLLLLLFFLLRYLFALSPRSERLEQAINLSTTVIFFPSLLSSCSSVLVAFVVRFNCNRCCV